MAQLNQKQITTSSQLQEALEDIDQPSSTLGPPELYDFDHIYSSDPRASLKLWQGGNATAAVLYATPGSQCFLGMHELLKSAMARQHAQGGSTPLFCLIASGQSLVQATCWQPWGHF